LNRNVRFLLIALATAVAFVLPVALFAIFSLPTHSNSLDTKREQVVDMSANVAFLHAAQRHRADMPRTLSAIETELAKERVTLPEQPSAAALRQDVDALAARCGCKVLRFDQQKSFTVAAVRVLPVLIEIEGDRDTLPSIVRDLESSATLTTVEAAQLKPVDDRRADLWVRADRYGVIERFGRVIVR
jgi:Tfp pilus assembly protein PilO